MKTTFRAKFHSVSGFFDRARLTLYESGIYFTMPFAPEQRAEWEALPPESDVVIEAEVLPLDVWRKSR